MVSKLTKKKKRGGTPQIPHMSEMPYGGIEGELDPLLNSMDCTARAQWCMANKDYCDDKIYDMYIKPCKNKATVFKQNKDHILSNLDCKARAQWCSVNKARRTQCLERDIQYRFIEPCKMIAEHNRTIEEILTQNTSDYIGRPLFNFYFDEESRGGAYINYTLEDYLNEVLWWLSKEYPISNDFPWNEAIQIIIITFENSFSRLPWFYIDMELYDFINIFSEDGRTQNRISADIIRTYFKRTINSFIHLVKRRNLPMDLTRCYRVFQRLLNALLIGNPTTTEFARYKMSQMDLSGIVYSDSDSVSDSDYDSDSDMSQWEPEPEPDALQTLWEPEPEPEPEPEEFLEVD